MVEEVQGTERSLLYGVTALGVKSRNTASERFLGSASLYLGQRRLGLRHPEGHDGEKWRTLC
jgi:hypothetical protein